jgi:UDP-3-O-[3-hydroxymyristoyl] glucosamine N-acyltransferase
VIIHPNTTIGSDGFGFQFIDGRHEKIPQIGHVVIESDVEIGANCSVDRGKWGATVIGSGTKIDNLVQIAHNVRIGRHCVIVSQVGIAGSSELGNHVVLGGKVGVRDHIRLGDGVQVAGASGVIKDTPDGAVVSGVPAIPHRRYLRERAAVRRLPEWTDRLKDLIQRVERLEAANDD